MQRSGDGLGLPRVPHAFVPAGAVAAHFSSLPPITVFRAPRGWGKTVTAAAWLRSLRADHEFAWIPITRPLDAGEFWDLVATRLAELDLGPGRWESAQVDDGLAALDRRLVLAVDNLHLVEDESIDESLMEVAIGSDRVHVVALTRTERVIETLAMIEADGEVFRVPELRLIGAEVHAMAQALDAELDLAAAEDLTRSVGGWPALIRASFLDLPRDDARNDAVGRYLRVVLSDPQTTALVGQAQRLAMAEDLDEEVARLLNPSVQLAQLLPRLSDAGFTGPDGQFIDAVRTALVSAFAEAEPAGARRAHATMAQWHAQNEDPRRSLAHAVRGRDRARCAALLHEHWLTLSDQPIVVRQALDLVGGDEIYRDPRAYVLSQHLDAVASAEAEPQLESPALRAELPNALLHWGAFQIGSIALGQAEAALQDAHQRAQEQGQGEIADNAAAGIALCRAIAGVFPEALGWLDACSPGADERSLLYQFASQIIALDAVEPEDESIAGWSEEGHRWGETIPPASSLPGKLHLLGRPLAAARDLYRGRSVAKHTRELGAELRELEDVPEHRLVRTVITQVLANLLIREGQLARCRALLTSSEGRHAMLHGAWARVAFYSGDLTGALARTERALQAPVEGGLRARVELLLVRACALHRLDRAAEAGDALHDAVRLAQSSGLLRPFLLMPRADLDGICAVAPYLRPFVDQRALTEHPDALAGPSAAVQLSPGELRVLEALAEGKPVSAVASRLFVSPNTVKSQLRAIYRKFGVHSRPDAIRRARELQILPAIEPAGSVPVAGQDGPGPRQVQV